MIDLVKIKASEVNKSKGTLERKAESMDVVAKNSMPAEVAGKKVTAFMKNGTPLCAAYRMRRIVMPPIGAQWSCVLVGHVVDTMQQQPAMTSEQFCMWLQHHRRQISNRRSKLK